MWNKIEQESLFLVAIIWLHNMHTSSSINGFTAVVDCPQVNFCSNIVIDIFFSQPAFFIYFFVAYLRHNIPYVSQKTESHPLL